MTRAESPEAAPTSNSENPEAGGETDASTFRSVEWPPKRSLIRTRSARFGRASSGGTWSSISGWRIRLLNKGDSAPLLCCTVECLGCNSGWIEVICGPMFSGKSEELMRRLRRAKIARKHVQVFKPILDNRYSDSEIVSHGDVRMSSEAIASGSEILERLEFRTEVVGIDEANFFGSGLVPVVNQLADSGRQVIVAGLDTDYIGRPFAPMPELLALAESVTKILAICVRCGAPAKHTQRLVKSEELILVGAVDYYEARCRKCFEPGLPQQEVLDFLEIGSSTSHPIET